MCDAASLRVLSSKVAFASPQRLSARRASFNRTVGRLVKCSSPSDSSRRRAMLHSQKSRMQRTNINIHSSARVLIRKSFAAVKPCEQHRIVLLQANVQLEDQMRVLAILLGVGTAVGIAAGVSPAPAASSIQLAQAQDSARRRGPAQAQASAAAPVTAKVATAKAAPRPRAVRRSAARRRARPAIARPQRGVRPKARAVPPFVSVPAARVSPFTAVLAGWSAYAPPPATMPS